jgi:hypothetical protein
MTTPVRDKSIIFGNENMKTKESFDAWMSHTPLLSIPNEMRSAARSDLIQLIVGLYDLACRSP